MGQLANGRMRLARRFAAPVVALALIAALLLLLNSPTRLLASMVSPTAMSILLGLNAIVLVWRIVSVVHAFFDGRYVPKPGRVGTVGLIAILVAVLAPHALANAWGTAAQAAFASVFTNESGPDGPDPGFIDRGPAGNERINILIVGVDSAPGRTETLTDSLMVVSVDPVGKTISMASMPRDLVGVPLGNGNTFSPKINSLMSYADRHPEQFPEGGMRSLENAMGALLGIPIHYYAKLDFTGFVKLVDAVGGVDINVKKAFFDPKYDGRGGVNEPGVHGWGVTAGPNHFNGWEALAYARSRYAPGESDFTRAARQQEILLAIKDRVMSGGSVFTRLPDMFEALGSLVTTDIPTSRLPDLAALADDMKSSNTYRAVLNRPIVKTGGTVPIYGSVQIPVLDEILAVARKLFPPPGETPESWPPPKATPAPKGTPTPAPLPS
ncbi:MAG: LCP family protein [Chloroflexota bacterium]